MGFSSYAKIGKDINIENDLERIMEALALAQSLMDNARIAPSKVTPIFCCKTQKGQLLKIFFRATLFRKRKNGLQQVLKRNFSFQTKNFIRIYSNNIPMYPIGSLILSMLQLMSFSLH